jgi:hypothetical protein
MTTYPVLLFSSLCSRLKVSGWSAKNYKNPQIGTNNEPCGQETLSHLSYIAPKFSLYKEDGNSAEKVIYFKWTT